MPDWTKPMIQTFEYYKVDPGTWKDISPIRNVKNCSINRDKTADTLGSAIIDIDDIIQECYIRCYLVTLQNRIRERHPLGTFLVQTPQTKFDGKVKETSLDAYTPLIELKENPPPLGYSILKGANITDEAYRIIRDNARAPVIGTECKETLYDDFVSNLEDQWITFVRDLLKNAKYDLDLDEMGRILFAPEQDTASLQPVCTFDDSNSSILLPEITIKHDLYNVPNVVEVIYSQANEQYYARVVNDDENSPASTVNRGREITHRINNPRLPGIPTKIQIEEYAKNVLKELSTLDYAITYTHGYRPVRIGDCVRLNYARSGVKDIKAKVISQNIKCQPGCPVTEKAIYTVKLWR